MYITELVDSVSRDGPEPDICNTLHNLIQVHLKLSNPPHQNLCVIFFTTIHVNTFVSDCLHSEPCGAKNCFSPSCFLSSLASLSRHSLNISLWLTQTSISFCSRQVHSITIFDKYHFHNESTLVQNLWRTCQKYENEYMHAVYLCILAI